LRKTQGIAGRPLPLVERVVAGLAADLRLLTAISDAIPYLSTALAAAAWRSPAASWTWYRLISRRCAPAGSFLLAVVRPLHLAIRILTTGSQPPTGQGSQTARFGTTPATPRTSRRPA
jgi:hypothetical protein